MNDITLSREQRALKEGIEVGAIITGLLCSLAVACVVWLFTRKDFPFLTYVFVTISVLVAYWLASHIYVAMKTEGARCKSCSADFSVAHRGREETLVSASPRKQEQVHGRVDGGRDDGKRLVIVETWTDERYEVLDSYRCLACEVERHTKSYRTVRADFNQKRTYRR